MKLYVYLIFIIGFSYVTTAQNSISGYVKDKNKVAINKVLVSILDHNLETQTNENGYFIINNLPFGKINIVFSKEYFEITALEIQVSKNEQKNLEIILTEEDHHLDEVLVASVFNKTQKENVVKIDNLNLKEIQAQGNITITDAIASNPGINVIGTGVSIGKPVIRGLSGNRVLTYAQGIRLENQQFGEEHGLGINANGQESVEIIKGPASLLYGSDAMGGVLYFNPEKYAENNTNNLEINQNYNSNTQGYSTSVKLKSSVDKFKFQWLNNFTSHNDYKTGKNETVVNTRFFEKDMKIGASYNTSGYVLDVRYNINQINLGLPELDLENNFSRKPQFPSQEITNHLLTLSQKFYFKNSKLETNIGYVFNNRKELESEEEIALYMKLKTLNYNLKYYLPKIKNFETIIGFQGLNQENRNFGTERLIPNAMVNDIGFFGTSQIKFNKNLLQLGLRYDVRKIKTETYGELGNEGYFNAINKSFESTNASIGLKTEITQQLTSRINIASGFRAPNLSELTSNGVHEGSNRYEIGNENLKNEQNLQLDLNLDYKIEHFDVFSNIFYNNIKNYIYISPNNYFIDNNLVYNFEQNNAALYGTESGAHFHPHPIDWLHITTSFETVIGKINHNNLPLIPASQLKNNFRANFNINKKLQNSYTFLQANYNFKQNKISEFETPTNDYLLISLGLGTDIVLKNSQFKFYVTASNLLNKQYVSHLSRLKQDQVSNIGRNIVLGINFNL